MMIPTEVENLTDSSPWKYKITIYFFAVLTT